MDQVLPIEAYKCPRCGEVSVSKDEAVACLDRHLEQERISLWRQKKLAVEEQIRFQVKDIFELTNVIKSHMLEFSDLIIGLELKTFRAWHFPKEGWCKPISFSSSSGKDYNGCMVLEVEYKVNAPNLPSHNKRYILENYFYKQSGIHLTISVNDGSTLGVGRLYICFEDFPLIQERYQEFLRMSEFRKAYRVREQEAIKEYEAEYYPAKLLSDIEYCALKMDVRDLQRELREKTEALNMRGKELDNEREVRTFVKPDFDVDKLNELENQFYFGK